MTEVRYLIWIKPRAEDEWDPATSEGEYLTAELALTKARMKLAAPYLGGPPIFGAEVRRITRVVEVRPIAAFYQPED